MYGVNKVILVGTIGKDNKVTDFTNGGKIVTNSLATTKKGYTTKNGNSVPDRTEWHTVVFHEGLAQVAEKYVKKGTNLYVEGELRTRKSEKNGTTYFNTEIHVNEMHMLPSASKNGSNAENKDNSRNINNNPSNSSNALKEDKYAEEDYLNNRDNSDIDW